MSSLKADRIIFSRGIISAYHFLQHNRTDGWGAYERHLAAQIYEVDKRKTQKIERKHLNLRTRIKRLTRKTICFSKTEEMHDLVIGLFINRYEFGLKI